MSGAPQDGDRRRRPARRLRLPGRRRSRCPSCLEPLAAAERAAPLCPHCGRSLLDDAGRRLRRIDLVHQRVAAGQRERAARMRLAGSAAAAALFAGIPLLHLALTPALVVPLAIVAHLAALRFYLVGDARRLLGRARRAFARWLPRLGVLWLGGVGYGLTAVPIAGIVAGVATFAGLTEMVHRYTLWSLDRELRREPLTGWEKALLGLLAGLTLTAVVALLALALLLGWSIAEIAGRIRPGGSP